jgi:hypothetical protein
MNKKQKIAQTLLILSLILPQLWPQEAFAMKKAAERTYVYSALDGIFYARVKPSREGSPAKTQIFQVGEEKDSLIDSYDFYSPQVELGWSPIAGKVAVLATRLKPSSSNGKESEIDFFLGGKHLKSYSTEELIQLGAQSTARLYEDGKHRADFKVIGCHQIPGSNEYDFIITLGKEKTLRFNILTGMLRSQQANPIKVSQVFPDYLKTLKDAQVLADGIQGESVTPAKEFQAYIQAAQQGNKIEKELQTLCREASAPGKIYAACLLYAIKPQEALKQLSAMATSTEKLTYRSGCEGITTTLGSVARDLQHKGRFLNWTLGNK